MNFPGRRIVCISVTERGRHLAARLPFEHVHGTLASRVRERWEDTDGFVLVAAAGACVRVIAPLLKAKATDPAIVCVDDAGRHVIALLGGHAAGANDLARDVAAFLGAEPVVTTATDATDTVALDAIGGMAAEGDLAAVTRAILDGADVALENPLDWPLPPALTRRIGASGLAGATLSRVDKVTTNRIRVTDAVARPVPGTVVLRPQSIVAGMGASMDPPHAEVRQLLEGALDAAGLSRLSLFTIATIDRRAFEPAFADLGHPITVFSAEELATVEVPNPSPTVERAVGTPSVAEAAALLAAGPGATLILEKRATPHATIALARRRRPIGTLLVVGLGPGSRSQRTPEADVAVRQADVVIGYGPYIDQCADLLGPSHEVVRSPIGAEVDRARLAIGYAAAGHKVAVVCSGDAGVYAMASIVLEEAAASSEREFAVEIVPGVTAAHGAAAALGAPLGHDHVMISLSDLLTPWEVIVDRIKAARDGDFVIALYNPKSKARDWQLAAVRDLLLERRRGDTPVGVASDVSRPNASTTITTLAALDPDLVGMTTCVIVGSSATRVLGGRMVTPRGYKRTSPTPTSPPPKGAGT